MRNVVADIDGGVIWFVLICMSGLSPCSNVCVCVCMCGLVVWLALPLGMYALVDDGIFSPKIWFSVERGRASRVHELDQELCLGV